MPRRRFTLRDIDEILRFWHQCGSIQKTATSLGVHRNTVRKYAEVAQGEGYGPGRPPPEEGWSAYVRRVFAGALGRSAPAEAQARLGEQHEEIVQGVAMTTAATVWQRLRDERGLQVSLPSLYRYLRRHVPEYRGQGKPRITLRRPQSPPGEVAEVDFGYLGLWWDPVVQRRRRVHAFVLVLAHSGYLFVWPTFRMDQRAWVEAHIAAFEFLQSVPARVVLDNLKSGPSPEG